MALLYLSRVYGQLGCCSPYWLRLGDSILGGFGFVLLPRSTSALLGFLLCSVLQVASLVAPFTLHCR